MDEVLLSLVALRGGKDFALCATPANEKTAVLRKVLFLAYWHLRMLFYIFLRFRHFAPAAVQIVRKGIGLQHIGRVVTVFVITPGGVNRLVGTAEGDLGDRCRCGVRATKNRIRLRFSPADKDNLLTIHIVVGRRCCAQGNLVSRDINFAIRRYIG